MSKQMSREEAVAELRDAVVELREELLRNEWRERKKIAIESYYNDQLTALAILAPEPRTEKPGVEVGERIWMYWESAWDWQLMDTEDAILNWDTGSAPWLPESALPMPKATDGTATFEKGEGA
jgi:hypothetical protein